MNPKVWVKQIKDKSFFFAFFDILFLFLSGIPVLFIFERSFFISTDWIKLLFFSGSIGAPFVFLNTIALALFEDDARIKKKDGLFFSMSMATMATAFFLDGPLPFLYYSNRESLKYYMLIVGSLEVIILGAGFVYDKWIKAK